MSKIAKIIAFVIPVLAIVILTAAISYEWGARHTREVILHSSTVGKATDLPPAGYEKSLNTLREQLNRLTNDYESACYNYQALYEAYDVLYAKAGASSGQAKIVRPDSARGNEVSCYR